MSRSQFPAARPPVTRRCHRLRAAEGFYGPVEVRKNEAALMKTVSEYEEMFQRRGYRYDAPAADELVGRLGSRLVLDPVQGKAYNHRNPNASDFGDETCRPPRLP